MIVDTADLVSCSDIAKHYKVVRPTISAWQLHRDFPKPVAMYGKTAVWYMPEVDAWYKQKWSGRNV